MRTLKVSVSLPDDTHPEMQLRLCANDADCDVVIVLPMQATHAAHVVQLPRAVVDDVVACDDDYTLGGYAGI
ncbi:hypothetical protein [Rhodanobacter sp. OK091]|uniref:hypothetical protein n=1 Tax=Rhodanobacter sp. OK091 TaxID=1881037 RepID=UPI00090EEF1F|nr:hypothetical protein [Rhodanobacter sp. OK091]SHL74923.1 hypothetical protein SAMN05428972_1030 [Rhodanobacter sp. OK091]